MADAIPDELVALVHAARRGDRRAFATLYDRFARAVHGVILARTHPRDAADLVQDVFALALARLPQLAEPAAFPGWILAIARNRVTDHLRAKKPVGDDDALQTLSTSDSGVRRSPEVTRVLAALRTL
ncbi:MAG: sigma-70 family RNA polymerase sigma factor, partial [Proteobacteria bacterium]|nr:sigma-70 family RNA polymerase sigma factor [Pseudomonadota bacterium]